MVEFSGSGGGGVNHWGRNIVTTRTTPTDSENAGKLMQRQSLRSMLVKEIL